jgi:hypothetical protein
MRCFTSHKKEGLHDHHVSPLFEIGSSTSHRAGFLLNYHLGVFWKWQATLEHFPETCSAPSFLLEEYLPCTPLANLMREAILTLILLLGVKTVGLI